MSGEVPVVVGARASFPFVTLRLRLSLGQTLHDFDQAAEAVRSAFGVERLRVDPAGPREVELTFTVCDQLTTPFSAVVGDPSSIHDVMVGRREDGGEWRLAVGPHTLVAGSSGSGKGSVFWSMAFGLAPQVRAGRVLLHGVDLKGGMEILMGKGLFTSVATSAADAVALLEDLAERMRERSQELAGHARTHQQTPESPLHVVMIDELAALTAYCPERDLQRRADLAINLLCSQGRAPGFVLFACLQDPRKEVIPSRGLFTQMVGLRLKDASETAMVLGDFALASGALCHRIGREAPGTGYVVPEEGGHPIRVRAGYATDDAIRETAEAYATSTTWSIPPLAPAADSSRARRARTSEGL
ncbi:FtsK/SpoIIIE domain-containing protein [Nocardioides taihuensis]|uniref:FtsK/SpoIIIE domain-containing protein n=1 Tax=Nocardioides taihuensis TaxID=1835606 RepID=A0ABW0BEC6_9ACTN